MRASLVIGLLAAFVISTNVRAEEAMRTSATLTGRDAFGDWQKDKPGVRRLLTIRDQPPVGPSSEQRVKLVNRPAGAKPAAPNNFSVDLVASGLRQPRALCVAPNGDLFVADSKANTVRVYRIPAGTSKPIKNGIYATGLNKPFGIAFYPSGANPNWVYIANTDSIVRFPYKNGDLTAPGKPEHIVEKIPSTHHWTRDLVFSADGSRMFLGVGSGSNVALDMFPEPKIEGGLAAWKKTKPLGATWDTEERRADVISFTPEGKDEQIFATGLRNCAGLTAPTRNRRSLVRGERTR